MNDMVPGEGVTAGGLLSLGRSFQRACVLVAAAELELFDALVPRPLGAGALAAHLGLDPRGTEVLLDALVAVGLVQKDEGAYSLPEGTVPLLTGRGPRSSSTGSVLAMLQHQANCLRRWAQLARVVKTGEPAERSPSVRGECADREAFIEAMDNVSALVAAEVVRELRGIQFHHVLDVGGGSGTWTLALLGLAVEAQATLFDLPEVIPMARRRLGEAGILDRVRLVAGDFLADPLPGGADLAWVSAIVHQNSREQNRALFASVFEALVAGGTIAIRDVLMQPSRTSPVDGALFAVNMLVGTEGGGTFTFEELRADLEAVGFTECRVLRCDPGMNSVVVSHRPAS